MPAAAVIPAPIAYIKVVAVKKLVVELWLLFPNGLLTDVLLGGSFFLKGVCATARSVHVTVDFYFEKIRVFKAGVCLNIAAWNNEIGRSFYFVGY